MIRVKYERYWADFVRKNEEKTFPDLNALADWIFSQMQLDYTKSRFVMSFPTPESIKRIKADGPYRIEFKPTVCGETISIYLIENSSGIIFSDGRFTAGQKHWNSEVKAWLTACEKRRLAPKFNFVDEQAEEPGAKMVIADEATPFTEEQWRYMVSRKEEADARRTYTVTEMCPHCESEVEIRWNTDTQGFKTFCPVCGKRLMLCDECRHAGCGPCDYDSKTDSCQHNPEVAGPNEIPPELRAETPLGAIIAKLSTDYEHPGICLDLRRPSSDLEMGLALVEFCRDEGDTPEGEPNIITRVWSAAQQQDYTDRIIHRGIEDYFKADEVSVNAENHEGESNEREDI